MKFDEKCGEYVMDEPVRVLQFTIGGPDFTGIASFLYQYYSKIDHSRVHYDFVFCRQNSLKLVMDDPVFDGSEFYELNAVNSDNSVNLKLFDERFNQLLNDNNFDVLHINTNVGIFNYHCATIARQHKVKVVVSHSHNSSKFAANRSLINDLKDLYQHFYGSITRAKCDYLFACSQDAGETLFGKKGIRQNNFKIICNAINSKQYIFSNSKRSKIRESLGVTDNRLVLGQIGRLSPPKNHIFTLAVFTSILSQIPKSELWLVGSGEDKDKLILRANELNILDHIKFLGERNDVADLLQGMDAIIFPSRWEGLGIVAIEGQAAGLPVYASTQVPQETHITDLITYLPLSDGPSKWADFILKDISKHKRRDTHGEIADRGYDIEAAAKWLEDFYCSVRK